MVALRPYYRFNLNTLLLPNATERYRTGSIEGLTVRDRIVTTTYTRLVPLRKRLHAPLSIGIN